MEMLAILGFILTVICTYIGLRSYYKTFDISEDRNNLLGVFKVTQKLHLEVQLLLQKYIDENNGANHELYTNITFQEYLNVAKEEYEKSLSDKVYHDLKNNQIYTKSNIASFLKMIETQNNALTQFKNQLLFLK
jgi:hypothetical protein